MSGAGALGENNVENDVEIHNQSVKQGPAFPLAVVSAGKVALCMIATLIAFEIIGGILSFLLDLLGALNTVLSYTLWFVSGVLCGVITYHFAGSAASPQSGGDWTDQTHASRTGLLVILTALVVSIPSSIVCYLFDLRYDLEFLVVNLASIVIAHRLLLPEPSISQCT